MIYRCDKCSEQCGVIRLSDDKKWLCDSCYFNRKKVKKNYKPILNSDGQNIGTR